MPAATSTLQHFPLLQAQIPFSRFIFTESLKYDWGDVTAVFSRSRRYHSPERAPKIKYFMSKNMKISPRKDPRLPPSWTLLGEAPKSDKNRGLHFLCKKGGKKLQYFGLLRPSQGVYSAVAPAARASRSSARSVYHTYLLTRGLSP